MATWQIKYFPFKKNKKQNLSSYPSLVEHRRENIYLIEKTVQEMKGESARIFY